MDSVAPEILHIVCSFLGTADVPNFRLVGRAFADIGAAYMLPEVTFFLNETELERLRDISRHPVFSRHVTSLTYFAWALDDPKISLRQFLARYKRDLRWKRGLGAHGEPSLSRDRLLAEYKKYEAAADKQKAILEFEADEAVLLDAMSRFHNLRQITMSTGEEGIQLYETIKAKRRPTARDTIMGEHRCDNLGPVGVRTLEALMSANADSGCDMRTFRAGELSWRFFKRSPANLARLFMPLKNLTRIELLIGVDLDDEHDVAGCKRVLGRGALRSIFRSIPQLEALHIDINSWNDGHQDRAVTLKDVFEPGFRWPKLQELGIGGLACERQELMQLLRLHKDTLRHLCLSGVHLQTTSWRRLLPDIRKTLYLTHACVCGDLHGQIEKDDDEEGDDQQGGGGSGILNVPWEELPMVGDAPASLPPAFHDVLPDELLIECIDLSLPDLDDDTVRTSVNCYLTKGGALYPDELPLDEHVAERHFDRYVQPYLRAWRRERRRQRRLRAGGLVDYSDPESGSDASWSDSSDSSSEGRQHDPFHEDDFFDFYDDGPLWLSDSDHYDSEYYDPSDQAGLGMLAPWLAAAGPDGDEDEDDDADENWEDVSTADDEERDNEGEGEEEDDDDDSFMHPLDETDDTDGGADGLNMGTLRFILAAIESEIAAEGAGADGAMAS